MKLHVEHFFGHYVMTIVKSISEKIWNFDLIWNSNAIKEKIILEQCVDEKGELGS